MTVNTIITSVLIETGVFFPGKREPRVPGESIDHGTRYFANSMSRTHFSSGSRNEVSKCGPRVIEIGSGRMGALSDYICKSNEAVDKMVEIYIHTHTHTYIRDAYTYAYIYVCISIYAYINISACV